MRQRNVWISKGKEKYPFGLGPFLDRELDEKNGIINTTILVIILGFCPSLHGTLTCDVHGAVLGAVEAFTLISQMQKPSFSVRELSPSSGFLFYFKDIFIYFSEKERASRSSEGRGREILQPVPHQV